VAIAEHLDVLRLDHADSHVVQQLLHLQRSRGQTPGERFTARASVHRTQRMQAALGSRDDGIDVAGEVEQVSGKGRRHVGHVAGDDEHRVVPAAQIGGVHAAHRPATGNQIFDVARPDNQHLVHDLRQHRHLRDP
jgi:hypothetical protein